MANDASAPEEDPAEPTQPSAPPPPLLELNVADNPELDRNPKAIGQKVEDAEAAVGPGVNTRDIKEAPKEESKHYDHERSRDGTRQIITLWLIGLLCVIVAFAFVALFARGASSGFTDRQFFLELKQVLDVLVGPVITLLASAVGFYFGSKQSQLGDQAKNGKPSND
jgi:hypothetical protein